MATVTAPSHPISVWHQVELHDVDWATYCQLRDEEANNPVRMTYLDGELILMSPEMKHDHPVELLGVLVRGVAAGRGLEVMGIRSTTLRRAVGPGSKTGAGKEADAAYYIGDNEQRMRRRSDLDLSADPPPDLAIEVENSRTLTTRAMQVYARLQVPEVWRLRAADWSVTIWRLDTNTGLYVKTTASQALPVLTSALIRLALARYEVGDLGEIAWEDWIKAWARGLPEG